jgi:hypothetical protein
VCYLSDLKRVPAFRNLRGFRVFFAFRMRTLLSTKSKNVVRGLIVLTGDEVLTKEQLEIFHAMNGLKGVFTRDDVIGWISTCTRQNRINRLVSNEEKKVQPSDVDCGCPVVVPSSDVDVGCPVVVPSSDDVSDWFVVEFSYDKFDWDEPVEDEKEDSYSLPLVLRESCIKQFLELNSPNEYVEPFKAYFSNQLSMPKLFTPLCVVYQMIQRKVKFPFNLFDTLLSWAVEHGVEREFRFLLQQVKTVVDQGELNKMFMSEGECEQWIGELKTFE